MPSSSTARRYTVHPQSTPDQERQPDQALQGGRSHERHGVRNQAECQDADGRDGEAPAGLTPGKYFNNPNPRNTAPRLIRKAVMLFRTPTFRSTGLLPMDDHGRFMTGRRQTVTGMGTAQHSFRSALGFEPYAGWTVTPEHLR